MNRIFIQAVQKFRALLLGRQLLATVQEDSKILAQAARHTAGLAGDYLEFGVWTGRSFAEAYHLMQKADDWAKRTWGLPVGPCRYFAFDSFEGLPDVKGIDTGGPFEKGQYSCGEKQFLSYLASEGVPLRDVSCVKGWYNETLTPETREKLGISKARIIHVDCDLYESTRDVLAFCRPLIQEGTIIAFDDWFQFRGTPERGEQRAFREWLEEEPALHAVEYMREYPFRNSFILSFKGAA